MRPIILIMISLLASASWHALLPRFWLAVLGATVSSLLLFYAVMLLSSGVLGPFTLHMQYFFLAETLHTDFLTAFWLAVLVSSVLVASGVALLVGWIFRRHRRRAEVPGN